MVSHSRTQDENTVTLLMPILCALKVIVYMSIFCIVKECMKESH